MIAFTLAGCTGLERWAEPRPHQPRDRDPVGSVVDSGEPSVCYPGVARGFDACVALTDRPSPSADYVYPPPLAGSPLYAAPVAFLDLPAADLELLVAPHFVLAEVADPADGDFAVVQVRAVLALQELRDELGALVVTSGYRNPAKNAAVGGVTWSRHQYGDAFDLVPLEATLDALGEECAARGASYVGVYETHRHCDWRDGAPDPAFFESGASRAAPAEARDAVPVRVGEVVRAPASGWDEGEPLREWTAFANGRAVAIGWGRSFVPPAGTDEVSVVVGREVERSMAWSASP